MLIPSPTAHTFDVCSCVISLETGRVIPPTLFFSFKIILDILVPLRFHIYFKVILSAYLQKSLAGFLTRKVLKLYVNLGRTDIFFILYLPIHKQEYLFLWCSVVSSKQVHKSSMYFVRYKPRYFIYSCFFNNKLLLV